MELMLTVMGWVAIAILAWFAFTTLRNLVRVRHKPGTRTDKVGKDIF